MLIYIHIPFCTRKCDYCHFYVIPDKDSFKTLYMEGLALEWQRWLPQLPPSEKIESVYFGGGTPALLGADHLSAILGWIRASPHFPPHEIEITLEANPENIDLALFKDYHALGINRVSIGIQAFDDPLLKSLGRTHSAQQAYKGVETVARAGFSNISIDLMYDLPSQTHAHWEHSLDQALSLPITHLSLYNLTFEPHTVFYKKRKTLTPLLPDSAASTHMYLTAIENLSKAGFTQYEISAFAKPSFEAQHNSGYWTAKPFLGFGPSAFSYWEGKRFRNIENLHRYVHALKNGLSPLNFEEQLPHDAHLRELLALHLRLLKGCALASFENTHGSLSQDTRQTLHSLESEGFLAFTPPHLHLTQKGLLFYDTVASEIV